MFERKYSVNEEVLEVLETIKNEVPGIDNNSQALRYIVLENYRDYEDEKNKLGSMARDVAIIVELVAGLSDSLKADIADSELSETYAIAKEIIKARKKKQSAAFRKRG
ncbi:hypothetical protein [Enterococcus sp. AZ072]|uniref:hypothetical protein n=1 Tax=unclassified Enterococcus TaxID=2608891 RepID=UPI003D28EDD9